ncbi:MAG TPA: hypothetical protein VJZ27_10260, partial [Aggregatilineales bacterium]|nr:hypothetical protein [Aggregatilineales bacterium]
MNAQEILQAYKTGNVTEARRLVEEALQNDPNNEDAWTVKMIVAEHAFEREAAMQRVLTLNPENKLALKFQEQLKTVSASALPPLETNVPGAAQSSSPVTGNVIQGQLPDLSETAVEEEETGEEEPVPDTFEMFWDCEFCGTKKLLGYTHKFCPHCGAQQNPDKRYFPSDDEKVAVKNHVYYGVDVVCGNCNTLNSAKADFCVNCGSPLEGAKSAQQLESQIRGTGEKFESSGSRDLVKERFEVEQARLQELSGQAIKTGTKPGWNLKITGIIGGLVSLLITICVGIGALLFWTNESTVAVAGHSWEREIKIEEFQSLSKGDWCDAMPGDAYSVSRSERERSSRQVPDGEDCRTRRVDNGDGTFSERQECTTRYRSEPIYDDYCEYKVDR